MTLVQAQQIFIQNVAKLINYAFLNDIQLTAGELYRTQYQQDYYLREGMTKVKRSRHQDKLAIDLNCFVNGKYIKDDPEPYKILADFWKSLHPMNRAGVDWGWDANHYEMNLKP